MGGQWTAVLALSGESAALLGVLITGMFGLATSVVTIWYQHRVQRYNRDDHSKVGANMAALTEVVTDLRGDVATVKGDVAAVKGDVLGVQSELAAVRSEVSELASSDSAQAQRLDVLERREVA